MELKSESDGDNKKSRWTDALAEELHKPVTRKFKKRRVYAGGVDKIWAADIVDMKAFAKDNKGVKYLLTVLDVFSKYGWIARLMPWSHLCVKPPRMSNARQI